jgi:hypothetical protein
MKLATAASDDAVDGERVLVVGVFGEVVARVDVVVTGGYDEGVLPVGVLDQVGDDGCPARAAQHRNAAALAGSLLHIDDDQCTTHGKAPSLGCTTSEWLPFRQLAGASLTGRSPKRARDARQQGAAPSPQREHRVPTTAEFRPSPRQAVATEAGEDEG